MRAVRTNRYIVFFAIAIAGCAVDLATKSWMFNRLGMPGAPGDAWWIVQDTFGFQTGLNEGALFGMGQGMSFVFAALSFMAAGGILFWLFYMGAASDWLLTVALGFVTGGIFGNLYDRLGMPGLIWNYPNDLHEIGEPVYAVRDWVLVMFGNWPWPTFNIADSMLVSGAVLLVWHAMVSKPDQPSQ
jgi:signal peptidase II